MPYARDHTGAAFHTLRHCALLRKTIRLTCRRCGHVARIDAVQLWWRFHCRHWDERLTRIAAHIFCGACADGQERSRAFAVAVTEDRPEPRNWPFPDERVWRQVMSRYRA